MTIDYNKIEDVKEVLEYTRETVQCWIRRCVFELRNYPEAQDIAKLYLEDALKVCDGIEEWEDEED